MSRGCFVQCKPRMLLGVDLGNLFELNLIYSSRRNVGLLTVCAVRLPVRCLDFTWSRTGCRKIRSTQEATSSAKRLGRKYIFVFIEMRISLYIPALSGG